MYDSKAVANRLIEIANEREGETLTPMQLLKLVYIAHGWMLALYHRPLIEDNIEAWQYGPVIPRLYNAIRKFRSQPVTEIADHSKEEIDSGANSIIKQVYEQYGHLSGPALSRLTHAPGTPWHFTYVEGEFSVQMSNDLIEHHFSQLAQ